MLHHQTTPDDAARECTFRAQYIAGELDHARGPDVAYHVSHALCALQTHAGKEPAVPAKQAREILDAIANARPHVLDLFADRDTQAFVVRALSEVERLVGFWSTPSEARVRNGGSIIRQAHRYVRWLRNACHNLALRGEIEQFHAARAQEARVVREAAPLFP